MVCLGNRKRLKRADRTYKDLKQKQKAKIADSMFEKTCDYYREHGKLPEKKEKKKDDADKPKVKRKGMSKKVCPNCGRKMKQQFIGLQHCKCGMSWKKDIGYFERTGDMVFALERRKVGKKTKQCPVIRYK